MINLNQRVASSSHVDDMLYLPFHSRQKSRLRVTLASGNEAALYLPRGEILRGGALIRGEDGVVVKVIAAEEALYQVNADSALALMRAAYHLGNRHVPLEIGDGCLRLEQDYVLKEMLVGLGMQVVEVMAPFEPEAGAYGGGHRHGNDEDMLRNLRPAAR